MCKGFCAGASAFLLAVAAPSVAQAAERAGNLPIDSGATAWMLTSTALVLLMVPGLAMFYGGLVRTKNVLGTMMHSFGAMAIIGVLWAVIGYSLSFGPNILHGFCGWDPGMFFLRDDMRAYPINGGTAVIPELVYAMFQGKFAIITPALIAGAFAERIRFRGYCFFIALWGLIVYCPLAHWVWSSGGFLNQMGAQDYAGGTVVHISAGVSALVCAIYLGARKGYPRTAMHPNNLVMSMMGAGLLWVGWFGFNAGSSVNSNFDTARALAVTQVAAAAAALAWVIIESIHHHKATSLGLCSGILAGLVAITPAAGVVGVAGAMALGALASLICYFSVIAKTFLGYDDSLDVFGIHGVAGIFGALGLSFFLRPENAKSLAEQFGPNWSVWHQFCVQGTAVGIAIAYAAIMSIVLVVLVEKTLGFRLDPVLESAGMDHALHGEHAYGFVNLQ
ncbi:MAG TPA: ammonium transporter [Tepidisphaeraceae bacterium]|nr:ammonium transporter [Tepidisphaeraceae bacterium]